MTSYLDGAQSAVSGTDRSSLAPTIGSDESEVTGMTPTTGSDESEVTGMTPTTGSDESEVTGMTPTTGSDESEVTGMTSAGVSRGQSHNSGMTAVKLVCCLDL